MCGLAGSINSPLSYPSIKETMLHRGPDAQAGYHFNNVDLFHLRLAILDIAKGAQPMHLADQYTIIFNGEIYNHQEIRQRFNISGTTSSDTETLLLLYQRFGTGFLEYLDGMFVFIIHDKMLNRLFIARDRAGKKPLYYYKNRNTFLFASELNCLGSMVSLQLEENNFYHYLRLGSFYRQQTPYKNVKELPAGTFLLINCNTLELTETRWWNIHKFYLQPNHDSLEDCLQKTDELLHKAIKRRLESSDLEVGSFLSGGIDSGLATAIGHGYNNNLKTFTVSFEDEYNEAPLAKLVAEKYATNHTEIKISFDNLHNDLERIVANYGEPFFDSSAIPSYYVSREAKKYLTVILNGDGADELFGGYRRYVPFRRYDFFKKNLLVKSGASFVRSLLPASHNKKSRYNYLYRLASLASKSHLEIYLSAGVDIFEDYEQYIVSPGYDYMEIIKKDFDAITTAPLSGLQKIMNMDFDTNLFGDLLVKMDIATMANSLEGRSPFLSKELLEYIPSINDQFKINGRITKYLLRQLSKKYLPPVLINQPKRGFEIPLRKWVNHNLKDMINDYLGNRNAFCHTFVNKGFVNGLINKTISVPEEKRAKMMWTLFALEIWYQKVYLHKSTAS